MQIENPGLFSECARPLKGERVEKCVLEIFLKVKNVPTAGFAPSRR
jgi:hypothetical protein